MHTLSCTTLHSYLRYFQRPAGRRGSQTLDTRCPLIPDFSINRSALNHPRNRGRRHALKPHFHRFISNGQTNMGNANGLRRKRAYLQHASLRFQSDEHVQPCVKQPCEDNLHGLFSQTGFSELHKFVAFALKYCLEVH